MIYIYNYFIWEHVQHGGYESHGKIFGVLQLQRITAQLLKHPESGNQWQIWSHVLLLY